MPAPFWQLVTLFIGIAETMRARKGWVEPSPGNVFKLRPEYKPGAARSALSARTDIRVLMRWRGCVLISQTGDLGWDPLQLYPLEAAGAKDMQTRELNNGRLGAPLQHAGPLALVRCCLSGLTCVGDAAMVAVVIFALEEGITGEKVTEHWPFRALNSE